MAIAPHKPCRTHNCSGITQQVFCQKCLDKGKTQRVDTRTRYKKKTKEENAFYKSKFWRNQRQEILAANPWCQCDAGYCSHPNPCAQIATVVDHKISRSQGGSDEWSSGNLRPMCKKCHDKKTANEDAKGARSHTEVVLVCGPPGSGKSTYVSDRAADTDLILDFDKIMSAICNFPFHRKPEHLIKFGFDARNAIIKRLEQGVPELRKAWIIEGAPKAERRNLFRTRLKASVIVLECPALQCLRHIEQDEQRDLSFDWDSIVSEWWRTYTPHPDDIKVNGEYETSNTNNSTEPQFDSEEFGYLEDEP